MFSFDIKFLSTYNANLQFLSAVIASRHCVKIFQHFAPTCGAAVGSQMFSTKERLKRRTGKNELDRPAYLKRLVEEYHSTKSQENKHQLLANLGNFAYDPINYGWLRNLKVIRLFLEELNNPDAKIVEYAIGGLCNLSLDFENKSLILNTPGSLTAIAGCLSASGQEISASALALLSFLITPKSKLAIKSENTLELVTALSRNPNKRLSNLAQLFLTDYCTENEVAAAAGRLSAVLARREFSHTSQQL